MIRESFQRIDDNDEVLERTITMHERHIRLIHLEAHTVNRPRFVEVSCRGCQYRVSFGRFHGT